MKIRDAASPRMERKIVEIEGRITEPVQTPERGPLAVTRVGDDSGDVRVVVWEREMADVLLGAKVGDQVRIRGEARSFQGVINISVGRSGRIELLEAGEAEPTEEMAVPGREVSPRLLPEEAPSAPPAVQPGPQQLTPEEIAFVKKLYRALKEYS